MLLIDTQIPSGSILYDRIDNDGIIHLNLNREFGSLTHSFYFKVLIDKTFRKKLTFSIDNAGQSPFADGWNNYAPFQRSDDADWKRISQGFFNGTSFYFDVDDINKDFFISWYIPYPTNKYRNWLAEISKSDLLTVNVNDEIPDYIVAGDKRKPAVVVVARQHPGESMASYVVEGFVDALIKKNALTENLLKKNSIIIFPLLNKSGVIKSYHRVNEKGIDLNRSWHSTKIEEITVVKNLLASFDDIHSIIDIHGDEISDFNYIYFNENTGDEFQTHFLKMLNEGTPRIMPLPKQLFVKRFVKQFIRKRKILTETGKTLSDFGKKEYNAKTFTLEISAKTTSENDCTTIGENLFNAIVRQKQID